MRLLFVSAVLQLPVALCWRSTSQSIYGAQISTIRQTINGIGDATAYESLGWLWTYPVASTDTTGLGKSITWAWDPTLCSKLLPRFRERFTTISFIDCNWIKAAMHRAFDTWSQNHPLISFSEVTNLCEQEGVITGGPQGGCEHAEIWVTWRDGSALDATAEQAALARPSARVTSSFRYTNGEQPEYRVGNMVMPRQVIEVVGGKIEFAWEYPMCWYLDSNFCSGFHALKHTYSPMAVYAGGVTILFTLWSIAMVFIIFKFIIAVREQLRIRWEALKDLDGDGDIDAQEIAQQVAERVYWRTQAFIAANAQDSVLETAAKWTVLLIPWPFYVYIFQVCWDCYDFEAAAAHEIGHLLGLGHPDTGAEELAIGYTVTGNNSFNSLLAYGTAMNASTCTRLWDFVAPGHPAGSPTTKKGVRPALMESFTTHNPSVCLSQDDYEGLLTLYPVCEGVPSEPQCVKAAVNIGYIRVTVFVIAPTLFALLLSIVIHYCLDSKERESNRALRIAKAIKTGSAKNLLARGRSGRVAPSSTRASAQGSTSRLIPKNAPYGAPDPDQARAASRIQAAKRGNADRQRLVEQKKAAGKIQAIKRGNSERAKVAELRASKGASKGAKGASADAGAGALSVQDYSSAGQLDVGSGAAEQQAATRLQAQKRGQADRARVAALRA